MLSFLQELEPGLLEEDAIDGDRPGEEREEAVLEDQTVQAEGQLFRISRGSGLDLLQHQTFQKVQPESLRLDLDSGRGGDLVEKRLSELRRIPVPRQEKTGHHRENSENDECLLEHCCTS